MSYQIIEREPLEQALQRALQLDPCPERAAHVVAHTLNVPIELVQDVLGELG